MGDVIAGWEGDGLFREENIMLLMINISALVIIWTPVTVAA